MANAILAASGRRLAESNEGPDYVGAVTEGLSEAESQRVSMKKERQADEDRVYEVKKMKQDESLRSLGLEQKLESANAEKAQIFSAIEDLKERGELDGADYAAFEKDRETWWKDSANQLKVFAATGEDIGAFQDKLATAGQAEQNWGKFTDFTNSMAISDNSPDAQKTNLAVASWKGKSAPPITSKNGKDYFSVPNIDINGDGKIDASDLEGDYDETQVSLIPVDGIAGGDFGSAYGEFEEKADFSTTMADWQKGNSKAYDRLSKGTATGADIAGIGNWFQQQVKDNPVKSKEILDTFFTQSGITPGSETARELGVEDTDGDGLITSNDISDVDMGEVFTGAILAQEGFKEKQEGDKINQDKADKALGRGRYAPTKPAGKGGQNTDPFFGKAFEGGAFNGQGLVGLKVGKGTVTTAQQQENGSWAVKVGKEIYNLGANPTEDDIARIFGVNKPKVEENPAAQGPGGNTRFKSVTDESFEDKIARLRGGKGGETPAPAPTNSALPSEKSTRESDLTPNGKIKSKRYGLIEKRAASAEEKVDRFARAEERAGKLEGLDSKAYSAAKWRLDEAQKELDRISKQLAKEEEGLESKEGEAISKKESEVDDLLGAIS